MIYIIELIVLCFLTLYAKDISQSLEVIRIKWKDRTYVHVITLFVLFWCVSFSFCRSREVQRVSSLYTRQILVPESSAVLRCCIVESICCWCFSWWPCYLTSFVVSIWSSFLARFFLSFCDRLKLSFTWNLRIPSIDQQLKFNFYCINNKWLKKVGLVICQALI